MAERVVGEAPGEFPEELGQLLCGVQSSLNEWRASGKKAGNFDDIRQGFDTLQTSAQTAGYTEVSRLSHAVKRLMDQYGDDRTSDYNSEQVLINLLEEMHDGLTAVAGMTPAAAEDHLRPLTSIVESLLPANETGTPDSLDSGDSLDSRDSRDQQGAADPFAAQPARKFSYLLDVSGELGRTRNRLGNTVEQMRRDLTALKYHANQIRGGLQALGAERDEGFQTRARKVNLQLDTLIQVERKLRERVSTLAGTLIQQSHYGERLRAGLIKAGMVRENMTLSRVLLVRVGDWRFAIRAAAIIRALRVGDEEISAVDGHRYIRTDDQPEPVPVVDLIGKISKSRPGTEPSRRSLVLIRSDNRTSAFEVGQFEGTAEVAIGTPGSQLASVRGITGVTILADGRIVPVLDLAEFPGHPAVRQPGSSALA